VVLIAISLNFPITVENESHCDFTKLREMLIRTNMEDLRDTTHTKHYELYRKDRLQQVSFFKFLQLRHTLRFKGKPNFLTQ
jgi:septin 6/8/11